VRVTLQYVTCLGISNDKYIYIVINDVASRPLWRPESVSHVRTRCVRENTVRFLVTMLGIVTAGTRNDWQMH